MKCFDVYFRRFKGMLALYADIMFRNITTVAGTCIYWHKTHMNYPDNKYNALEIYLV